MAFILREREFDRNDSLPQGALLGRRWGAPGALVSALRLDQAPGDALAEAVALEQDQRHELLFEPADRVVQPFLPHHIVPSRQRVVNMRRPTEFLKTREDSLLILSRLSEPLEQLDAEPELAALFVPPRNKDMVRRTCDAGTRSGARAMRRCLRSEKCASASRITDNIVSGGPSESQGSLWDLIKSKQLLLGAKSREFDRRESEVIPH
jgi:hypothetical protein